MNTVHLLLCRINGITVHDNKLFYPQEKKVEFIKSVYRTRPDIKIFIETGTFMGDTPFAVKNDFTKIYSIELSKEYAQKAVLRFKEDKYIKIIQGDSITELAKLIKNINEPCFFWLDGHYSGGDTAKGEKEAPVLEEVLPILKMNQNHIILIDDARLFIGSHSYPYLFSFVHFVKKYNKKYKMSVANDIIILTQNEFVFTGKD